jgi:hypothetical protein
MLGFSISLVPIKVCDISLLAEIAVFYPALPVVPRPHPGFALDAGERDPG